MQTNPYAPSPSSASPLPDAAKSPLLQVKGLEVGFELHQGMAKAINGLNLDILPGEMLCLVGESGCGKSVTAHSILRLIPEPGVILGGEIWFEGRDLLKVGNQTLHHIRGNRIAMIFQEPMTSLNPVYTIGFQLMETLRLHQKLSRKAAAAQAESLLAEVGLPNPRRHLHEYPHQLSGGMRQRIMIAMALSCRPALLIADEPTTALDVTIQAQILELLRKLQETYRTAVLFITHDLGVVAEIAHRVAVMYAGEMVEQAPVGELFASPRHPYTRGLIRSIPQADRELSEDERLHSIPGRVPHLLEMPAGCRFAFRCERARPQCVAQSPPLTREGPDHHVRCFFPYTP